MASSSRIKLQRARGGIETCPYVCVCVVARGAKTPQPPRLYYAKQTNISGSARKRGNEREKKNGKTRPPEDWISAGAADGRTVKNRAEKKIEYKNRSPAKSSASSSPVGRRRVDGARLIARQKIAYAVFFSSPRLPPRARRAPAPQVPRTIENIATARVNRDITISPWRNAPCARRRK